MIPTPSAKQVETVAREIADQFGLTAEDDFRGLYALIVLSYPIAQEAYRTLKALDFALQTWAKYLGAAETDLQAALGSVPGQTTLPYGGQVLV